MSHANARFTPAGRLLVVRRIEAGMPPGPCGHTEGPASRHGRQVVAPLASGGRGRSRRPVLVKNVGKIVAGGGWRVRGRGSSAPRAHNLTRTDN